ncbi:hypothetical protein CBER1_08221 [Cercospora berteroae]|uniref:Uncharacterized protein n=1 Tax=Cercospora berteroae TaxID=357750 RepID=A0A2S6CGE8_9PEZI|nr:hypothetical protein CBER1_08221 [Cercospora berteroae]
MSPRFVWGATPAIVSFKGSPPLGSFGTDSPIYVDAYLERWPRLKIGASSKGIQAARSSVDISLRKCKVDVFDTDVLFDDSGEAAPRIKAYWDEVQDVVLPKGGYSKLVDEKVVYTAQTQYRYLELRLSREVKDGFISSKGFVDVLMIVGANKASKYLDEYSQCCWELNGNMGQALPREPFFRVVKGKIVALNLALTPLPVRPNWHTLMKWLERYHGDRASAPTKVTYKEWGAGKQDIARLQVATMFDIALGMRPYDWSKIEATFFAMRTLLCAADACWITEEL